MNNTLKLLLIGLLVLACASLCALAQTNTEAGAVFAAGPTNASQMPAANVEKSNDSHDSHVDIVAILSSFGLPVLVVGMALFFKFRRDQLAHQTVRAMVEKGVPITPELLAQLKNKDPDDSKDQKGPRYLLPGLICAGIGAALLISNLDSSRAGVPGLPPAAGWIVLFIGVAFLIVWLVERNNKNDALPPRQ
jgi:ABC-type Fe3+-siderophore transport system permease subunit